MLLTVCAQTMMKIGGTSATSNDTGFVQLIVAYIKSPLIVLGFGLSAIAAFLFTFALAKLDYSFVSLATSASYILIMLVSLFVFKESVPPIRWIGCGLILVGVVLVLKS